MTMKLHTIIPIAFLCGCTSLNSAKPTSEFVPMVDQSTLSKVAPGIWKSDGYGYILDNTGAPVVYNTVGDFCQLIEDNQEGPLIYFDRLRIDGDREKLFLSSFTEPHEIGFDRIANLPASCLVPSATDALSVFDVFAET